MLFLSCLFYSNTKPSNFNAIHVLVVVNGLKWYKKVSRLKWKVLKILVIVVCSY